MGSLFKAPSSTQSNDPWAAQRPYLKEGFRDASQAKKRAKRISRSVDDLTANMTDGQTAALEGLTASGFGAYQGVADDAFAGSQALAEAGLGLLAPGADFGENAANIYRASGEDRTGSIIDNASKFADNPYLQGQIDSVLGDITRAFGRDQASINSAATGTGNINSTRAGVLESRALDDAQDRAADVSSSLRGAAYESGLDRSMALDNENFSRLFGANQQLAASAQSGLGAILAGQDVAGQALDTSSQGFQNALNAGTIEQTQVQQEIEGRLRKAGLDQSIIDNYMRTIGGSFGGTSTVSGGGPSVAGGILGTAVTLGGLFCWVAREVYGEDDPRWKEFRRWMLLKAPRRLRRSYAVHGKKIASFVKRNAWSRWVFRPLMDIARWTY